VRIQSIVRMWLCYRHYHDTLNKIVKVQCCIRRWFARRCLKALKKEARSVAHVTKLNKGLENKIYMMQQKITELVSFYFQILSLFHDFIIILKYVIKHF
jgi:myosin V